MFSLSALTSLLLLQYIARRFGDLVGRGLTWQVITEFMLLSIPFTLALTVPMSVLVAVLYAFSRLASENEITALKAGGVSTRSLMKPVVVAGSLLAVFMLYFNDQLMSRANHELATLQSAILRTKPTFALRPQVLNTVKESQLYLRAGVIDPSTGLMRDITIYDLGDPNRRRTIYADSGTLAFAENKQDLRMLLSHGVMMSAPNDQPQQLSRIYYKQETLKVKDVANSFNPMSADTTSKGDREMTICEMQRHYDMAATGVNRARYDSAFTAWRIADTGHVHAPQPAVPKPVKVGGIGAIYCTMITKYFRIQQLQAAELPPRLRSMMAQDTTKRTQDTTKKKTQDTTKKVQDTAKKVPDSTKKALDTAKKVQDTTKHAQDTAKNGHDSTRAVNPSISKPAATGGPVMAVPLPIYANPANPAVNPVPPGAAVPNATPSGAPPGATPPVVTSTPVPGATPSVPGASPMTSKTERITVNPELKDAGTRIVEAKNREARFGIEIQKKFSLAAACIVFVLIGAPLAVRFPRGGVGLVIGASFFVFAVYYIALTSGESLANRNIISPFWAMWADNIIFLGVGIPLIIRMGTERVTSRGGGLSEKIDGVRLWFARQRGGRGKMGGRA